MGESSRSKHYFLQVKILAKNTFFPLFLASSVSFLAGFARLFALEREKWEKWEKVQETGRKCKKYLATRRKKESQRDMISYIFFLHFLQGKIRSC